MARTRRWMTGAAIAVGWLATTPATARALDLTGTWAGRQACRVAGPDGQSTESRQATLRVSQLRIVSPA